MGKKLNTRIETWKKLLLDFGKRNRLINFIEGKRNCLRITSPVFDDLYESIVTNEREISFPFAKKLRFTVDGEEVYETVIEGDIETSKPIGELQKTLKNLRNKARISLEEQGINTLYLTFGMLEWEEEDTPQTLSSPIILVPVKLEIGSLSSPYRLSIQNDDIVVNPTLAHKLENDFNIVLPDFESSHDIPEEYLQSIDKIVASRGWVVDRSSYLTNLSFLKINMYKDLERNVDLLNDNKVISALAGENKPLTYPRGLDNFDHDKKSRPIDTFNVVDADSSQQDAILLSKKGVSFVLQGPPGTGKSQTITNIIAEAMADGKKVLFVSEKMAALQVVHNRLASAGLGDFCFTLHSHKAKKKEILSELENSINTARTRVNDDALTQLEVLEKKRTELNSYQKQLHTTTSSLDTTIYAVNGLLAELENMPDVIFDIPDIGFVTRKNLDDRIYLLSELAKTIGKKSEDYTENAWRGSNVTFLSNELRHNIDSYASSIIGKLEYLSDLAKGITSILKLETEYSANDIDNILSLAEFIAESPLFPLSWLSEEDIDALIEKAKAFKEKADQILSLKCEILKKYDPKIFEIDAQRLKTVLLSLISMTKENLCSIELPALPAHIQNSGDMVLHATATFEELFDRAASLSTKIGMKKPERMTELITFYNDAKALSRIFDVTPPKSWFDANTLPVIKRDVLLHYDLHENTKERKNSILSKYDKEVLDIDYYPMLQRFRLDYSSSLRIFKGSYRTERNKLSVYKLEGGKITFKEGLDLLNSIKFIADSESEIKESWQLYNSRYGDYYKGYHTQWTRIEEDIKNFEKTCRDLSRITPELANHIESGELPQEEISKFILLFEKSDARSLYESLVSVFNQNFDIESDFDTVRKHSKEFGSLAMEAAEFFRNMDISYENLTSLWDLLGDLDSIVDVNKGFSMFADATESLESAYGMYFNGLETDWDKLLCALHYVVKFKCEASKYNLDENIKNEVGGNKSFLSLVKAKEEELASAIQTAKEDLSWFASLFDEPSQFYNRDILEVASRIEICKDKKYLLEEWVDYCSNKKKCEKAGMAEYMSALEHAKIAPSLIPGAYLKRFYRLWLDLVVEGLPAVLNFRHRIQSQRVEDFCKLDKEQFIVAQARVRERITNRIPNLNAMHEAIDEIAILKRELNKQRRLMPLRKLFKSIPNLVTTLRPCFMMSPLSVSVFLEADTYNFDMVIFDEASQVHTEDAIGSIMRGKQVIIVGDTKQLPPTSFFTTSLNDEDFDVDSEDDSDYDYAGAFDSILDEAVTVMPERSLTWHYRSRHEDLIAFSNIKIYNGQLITFPSAIASARDFGVEYVYVNGIYERGGKRHNMIEATKVAELVFQHFKDHPGRSLGVVTFSESQQNAVDMAIRQKRMEHPEFEKFFIEDKEAAFFIKNLENVQGDERDTIIFSIGYAKDKNGIMYMNFGPLSREGGYRRLNVAITRAKYNVKLVGSILPDDIDLEKTSSQGVRMLRSYIEFAKNGISALNTDIVRTSNPELESKFEFVVKDFLESKGYDVVTQVGCSGFRVDMAVKYPGNDNRYAIGIECDGQTYHNTRTVRERDRLRPSMLTEMGWNVYRVWSTDWIKDPVSEKQKLLNAIEESLEIISRENSEEMYACVDGYEKNHGTLGRDCESHILPVEEIETVEEEPSLHVKSEDVPDKFQIYERCKNPGKGSNLNYKPLILDILKIEQPVHFKELCKRLMTFAGRKNLTTNFINDISEILLYELNDKIVWGLNETVRLKDFNEINARKPNPDDYYLRPITQICDEELALGLRIVSKNKGALPVKELFVATAKEFGFVNPVQSTLAPFNRIYNLLLKDGIFTESEGIAYLS